MPYRDVEYVINDLLAADYDYQGYPIYRVCWEVYSADEDTWEPESALLQELVIRFLRNKVLKVFSDGLSSTPIWLKLTN
jgi:Chromo (CHRromatin Organisation MOdifier) domain